MGISSFNLKGNKMNAFLNALKQQANQVQSKLNSIPTKKIEPVKVEQPITVRIERVLNRNRLDIFFSNKPDTDTLNWLKEACFNWDKERKAWYHKDTILNRALLATRFNAGDLLTVDELNQIHPTVSEEIKNFTDSISHTVSSESDNYWDNSITASVMNDYKTGNITILKPQESIVSASSDTIRVSDTLPPKNEPEIEPSPIVIESTAFLRYKRQVSELMDYLELDAADLMLKAIDCLYQETIERSN